MPVKKHLLGEAVVPGIAVAFGISYFIQTADAPEVALFWPAVTATVAGLLLLVVCVQAFLKRPSAAVDSKQPQEKQGRIFRPALILAGPLGYLFMLPYLGFSLANFIFMLCLFRGLGSAKWGRNLLVAAVIAAFLHLALIVFMKLSLPRLVVGGTVIL